MARILIAEHNSSTADFLYNSLKKAGNSVQVVDNCLDAWRMSSQDHYDVLMIDIVMPGVDGFVLAQKALQENPSIQIIFLTGFAGVAMDSYASSGGNHTPVTTRPFHLKDIAGRVRYMLGQGSLPMQTQGSRRDNNIVYADFTHKTFNAQQVQQ